MARAALLPPLLLPHRIPSLFRHLQCHQRHHLHHHHRSNRSLAPAVPCWLARGTERLREPVGRLLPLDTHGRIFASRPPSSSGKPDLAFACLALVDAVNVDLGVGCQGCPLVQRKYRPLSIISQSAARGHHYYLSSAVARSCSAHSHYWWRQAAQSHRYDRGELMVWPRRRRS